MRKKGRILGQQAICRLWHTAGCSGAAKDKRCSEWKGYAARESVSVAEERYHIKKTSGKATIKKSVPFGHELKKLIFFKLLISGRTTKLPFYRITKFSIKWQFV